MLERLLEAAGFRLETTLVNSVRPSQLLMEHGHRVAELLKRHEVDRAWVFGSVARGDDRSDSDLDILVEMSGDASFEDHLMLEEELAAELGCPVDVITTKELKSNDLLRRRVNRNRRQLEIAA